MSPSGADFDPYKIHSLPRRGQFHVHLTDALIYNGFWFSPDREMLQALIDKSQENVEGLLRLSFTRFGAR